MCNYKLQLCSCARELFSIVQSTPLVTELVRAVLSEGGGAAPENEVALVATGDIQSTMSVLTKMKHTLNGEQNI